MTNPAVSPSRERTGLPGILWFLLLMPFAMGAALVPAEPLASAFDDANKLYEQAKFSEAAAAYEKLLQNGQASEAIYFNWGNALFKSGRIGRAIAAYQQAERISPRDPDVRANLQFARNQVQGPTLLPDRLSRWLGKLSLNEWTWLAAAAAWAWLMLLTLRQWRPVLKAALKAYVVWLGLLTVALGVCFGAAFYFNHYERQAIVVAQETVARQAPLDESPSAFTLHDGAELQVLDQKDQWLQVQVDARRIGWVRKDSVALTSSG
jgi:tetratricopeptide (TPR) repeat protein